MKKWKLSLIGNVLAAAMLITSLPLNMLPVQAAEASGKEVESATVAELRKGRHTDRRRNTADDRPVW